MPKAPRDKLINTYEQDSAPTNDYSENNITEVSVSKPDTLPPNPPNRIRQLNDEVDSHDGNIYWTPTNRFICQNIRLMAIHHNIDEDTYSFILSYDYLGQEKVIELPRDACLTKRELIKLQRRGLMVTEKTAEHAIEYLLNIEQSMPEDWRENVHSNVGFDVIDEDDIFNHYAAYGVKSKYTGPLDIMPKGSYSEWFRMVRENVLGNPQLEAILVLGFSSAVMGLVAPIFGLDSMLVHISGDSSTGKSISAKLAVSVWGNPSTKISNGLATTWNATDNAILTNLIGNHGLAVLLDEISMSEANDFTKLIYKLAGSKDKSRLTKEIKPIEAGTWATTFLTTGEFSLIDKSKKTPA
jgi:hypothetical protein